MRGIRPDFRTIAEFRKENVEALKKVYKDMVVMCTEMGIIGEEYSQDGVKIEAVNSKEKNYTLNKIDDRIKRIEEKIEEYIKEMDEIDKKESKEKIKMISKEELEKKIEKKKELKELRKRMEEKGENQISITDSESKLMKNNGKYTVSYNNQVVVDSKSHIVVNYKADNNPADVGTMEELLREAKETTGKEIVKNITDKGYNDRKDMAKCLEEGIIPEVTLPEGKEEYEIEIEYEEKEVTEEEKASTKKEEIKKVLRSGNIPKVYEEYIKGIEVKEKREYETIEEIEKNEREMSEEEKRDYAMKNKCFVKSEEKKRVYCPEGEILRKKSETKGLEKYCNKERCKMCKNPCTTSKYKEVMMSHKQKISRLKEARKEKPKKKKRREIRRKKVVIIKYVPKEEDIKKRMGISEHVHGTMKRNDNASYFLLRGKNKVNGELALYYLGYNIRRLTKIKKVKEIIEYIEKRGERLRKAS